MTSDEKYMSRCFELARYGMACVAPNPMVGAVVVHRGEIIGEGFHACCGEAHAEPNAIKSVENQELLSQSTLYVNLEPCSHYGKTPPCAKLIIEKKIPRVVISNKDPFPKVSGGGIRMLREAGVEVITNVLEREGRELNCRFFTFHEQKRPYVILKWAQSTDGFIDRLRTDCNTPPVQFSTPETQRLNHQLRAQEAAILVGTNTVLLDNPHLTTRLCAGKNPLRIVIDRSGKIPENFHLYNKEAPTLIFTEKVREDENFLTFAEIDFSQNVIPQIFSELYRRDIISLIVEGGAKLLQSFIDYGVWDEARVEIAPLKLENGVSAPKLKDFEPIEKTFSGENMLLLYRKNL